MGSPFSHPPLFRAAADVVGWTDAQAALFCLQRDRNNLAAAEQNYTAACAALGSANRMNGSMRRYWQGQAFRTINARRKQLREARVALAGSLAVPDLTDAMASV